MSTTCDRGLGFNSMETAVENTFSQLFFLRFNYNCFKALLLLIALYMTGRTLFLKNQFIIWVFSIIPEKYLEQTQLEFLWLWWWWIFFVVWFSLIFSWDHCRRSSPSRISDTRRAGFEHAQNLSSELVEWSCAVVITTTPDPKLTLETTEQCVILVQS